MRSTQRYVQPQPIEDCLRCPAPFHAARVARAFPFDGNLPGLAPMGHPRLPVRTLRPSTSLLLVLACVGCAHPAARRLQGDWVGEGVENVDLNQLAIATGWARGLRFQFEGERATVTIPTELARSGPFKVVNANERTVTIAIERPDHVKDMATFALDTATTMRWQLGEGRSVVFRRLD